MTDTIVFILALASPLSRNRLHLQHMTDTSFHLLCQSFVAEAYAYEIMDWPKREWTGPWLSWMLWLTVASNISLCQKVTLLVQLHYWVPNICLRVPKRERERERDGGRETLVCYHFYWINFSTKYGMATIFIWRGACFYLGQTRPSQLGGQQRTYFLPTRFDLMTKVGMVNTCAKGALFGGGVSHAVALYRCVTLFLRDSWVSCKAVDNQTRWPQISTAKSLYISHCCVLFQ